MNPETYPILDKSKLLNAHTWEIFASSSVSPASPGMKSAVASIRSMLDPGKTSAMLPPATPKVSSDTATEEPPADDDGYWQMDRCI